MNMRICLQIVEKSLPPMTGLAMATLKGHGPHGTDVIGTIFNPEQVCSEKSLRQTGEGGSMAKTACLQHKPEVQKLIP